MKPKKSQAWDPDKPCSFRIWHRRLQLRAKVIGYSLREFCEEQKWDWSEIVGSYISANCEPKCVTWYVKYGLDNNAIVFYVHPKKGE